MASQLLTGYFFLGASIGALLYCGYSLYMLNYASKWINRTDCEKLPPAFGLWKRFLYDSRYKNTTRQNYLLRSRQQSAHWENVLSVLNDGVILIDERGILQWANSSAHQLFNLHHSDVGRMLTALVRDPLFIRHVRNNSLEPFTLDIAQRQLQCSIQSIAHNLRVLLARDVTQDVAIQKMRRDFFANVSHELNTPLTVIIGHLELLNEEPISTQYPPIQHISDAVKRLQRLVDELTVLSQLESQPAAEKLDLIPVLPLLEELHRNFAVLQGHRRISVCCQEDVMVCAEEQTLYRVITNLVKNAMTYTTDTGQIQMSSHRHDDGKITIAIQDNGCGIAPEHIPRLTERFYRVDNSRSIHTGGCGLGLAIVAHALQRWGAFLAIESRQGQGSTFSCIFPPPI